LSVENENVKKDIRMRGETDSIMSSAWVLVYLLPFIVGLLLVVLVVATFISTAPTVSSAPGQTTTINFAPAFAGLALVYVLLLFSFIADILLVYKLARRRNSHFKRQIFLFEDVVTAVRAIARRKGVDVEVGLASGDRAVREAKAEETEKSAVLWTILSVITGIAVFYVWYFLMKDFYKHERREDGFWEDLGKTLDKCGLRFSVPRRTETLPDRSFALFFILTLVTLGLFGIYWVYVLLKDPNEHFRYHVQVEDQLLTALETFPP
jgi:flagellar biosynthesis/type III secretory pathway M-ring protein FliF/YscJ